MVFTGPPRWMSAAAWRARVRSRACPCVPTGPNRRYGSPHRVVSTPAGRKLPPYGWRGKERSRILRGKEAALPVRRRGLGQRERRDAHGAHQAHERRRERARQEEDERYDEDA